MPDRVDECRELHLEADANQDRRQDDAVEREGRVDDAAEHELAMVGVLRLAAALHEIRDDARDDRRHDAQPPVVDRIVLFSR